MEDHHLRIGAARHVVALLGDVLGAFEPQGRQIGREAQRPQSPRDIGPSRPRPRQAELESQHRRALVADVAPDRHETHADAAHARRVEVREPRAVGPLVRNARRIGVLEPHLDVARRIEDVALDDPRIDRQALEPLLEPQPPFGVGIMLGGDLPVPDELEDPAGHEVFGARAHDRADEPVATHPPIAVFEEAPRAAERVRSDDEGRVRHDEIEGLARDRFEEGALADLDVEAVERRVETGEGAGARRQVRRDDPARVSRQVHRLDAAAAPHVEGGVDAIADRHLEEARRGAADAEDVIGPQRPARPRSRDVGGDPPGDLPGRIA